MTSSSRFLTQTLTTLILNNNRMKDEGRQYLVDALRQNTVNLTLT